MNTQQNPTRLRRSIVAAAALGTSAALVLAAPIAALAHDGANSAPNVNYEYPSVVQNGTWSANVLLNDNDPDGDALVVGSWGAASHGVVSGNPDGSVSFTPAAGYVGYDTFGYTVVDEHGLTTAGEVHFDIYDDGIPDVTAPVAVEDHYNVTPGGSITVDAAAGILANDLNVVGPGWYIHPSLGPFNGSLAIDDVTGAFTYTPNAGFVGTDTYWYEIYSSIPNYPWSNGVAVKFHVANAPVTPPTALGETYTLAKDSVFLLPAPGLLANDTSGNGNPIDIDSISFAAHGAAALYADGHVSYTPDAGFVGTDTVTYRVRQLANGSPEAYSATVTVTFQVVEPVNPNPVPTAVADFFTTSVDTAVGGMVLANDLVDSGVLSAQLAAPAAAHGTVDLYADGTFNYVPDAGFVGTDTFGYQALSTLAQPWLASETALVTIEVLDDEQLPEVPENLPPVAVADNYSTPVDTALYVDPAGIFTNDYDPEGDAFLFALVSAPAHGAFIHAGSGAFSYLPDPGFVGVDTLTYRLDGVIGEGHSSEPATITITVTDVELDTQDVPCSPTQPGGCDEPGDEAGGAPGGDISTLALTGSDGSTWIVLASFLLIYAGGMALRFARKHPVTGADEA